MSRAEDLLEEVITITKDLAGGGRDDDLPARAAKLTGMLEGQRGKFIYKTLPGVPNANRCKKAAHAVVATLESDDASAADAAMSKLETEVRAMIDRADAPGVVLT